MGKKIFKKIKLRQLPVFFAAFAGCGIIVLLLIHFTDILNAATGLLGWIMDVLSGFIAGLVIAYLLCGVVNKLQKQFQKFSGLEEKPKLARGLAVASTYLLIFIVIFAVLIALILAITKQVKTINFADLPRLIQQLQLELMGLLNTLLETLEKIGIATDGMEEWINNLGKNITGSLASVGTGVFTFAGSVTSVMTDMVFAVIFSVYFLYDTDGLMSYWSNAFHALLGQKTHHVCAILLNDADKCFSGYIRGQLADAAFMAIAVSILLGIVGVPYAVVIGILSGIGNLIPYVGPIVAYGLTIGVCIATGEWTTLLIALIMVFILQTVDGNIVNPRLLSQSIDVHPVLVIVGLLFGSAIGGFVGMMLAVPVASFFKIQFERLVKNRSNKQE